MDIFNIVFQTFWHWLGTFLLLVLVVELISRIVGSFGTRPTYIRADHVTVEASEANIKVKGDKKTPKE